MTESVRDALREAAPDDLAPPSGITGQDLFRRGRRKVRLRRATAGGLALAAIVGVPLASGMLSGSDEDSVAGRSPAVAKVAWNVEPSNRVLVDGTCTNLPGRGEWTVQVAVQDHNLAAGVLTSSDGQRLAKCTGNSRSDVATVMIGRTEDDPGYDVRIGFWYDGCATSADPQVCAWGMLGQISTAVVRMTVEQADGQTSDVEVRDGFFAWQSEVESIDVFNQPLWVTLYDADGDRIDLINANHNPDSW